MNTVTKFKHLVVWLIAVTIYNCLAPTTIQAQTAPTWLSVQRTTSTGTGSKSSGNSIAVAPDGSRYVTGTFAGVLTLGTITLTGASGQGHIFLAKYSASGTVLWATQFDGRGLSAKVVVDAAGNAYLTGTFAPSVTFGSTTLTTSTLTTTGSFDAYVVKYDAQGVRQWVKQGGGDSIESYAIALDSNSNVIIVGDCQNSVSFGGTILGSATTSVPYRAFYYKFSPSGAILQAKQVSTSGEVNVNSIAVDGADNVYITGQFAGNATFGATTITAINSVDGNTDLFLGKLDATGNVSWVQRDGSSRSDGAASVTVDAAGDPILCGSYGLASSGMGGNTIYVARFTAQGVLAWTRLVPLSAATFAHGAYSVSSDGRGGSFITGSFVGTAVFGTTTLTAESTRAQLFIARYDRQGNVLWAEKLMGTATTDTSSGNGLVVEASGEGYLIGNITNTATFGVLTTTSASTAGTADTFIAKFSLGSMLGTSNPSAPRLTLQVYPNPAASKATVLLPSPGGVLVLVDALGHTVYQQVLPTTAPSCTLPLNGLSAGLYHLRATFSNGQSVSTQLAVEQ